MGTTSILTEIKRDRQHGQACTEAVDEFIESVTDCHGNHGYAYLSGYLGSMLARTLSQCPAEARNRMLRQLAEATAQKQAAGAARRQG